MENISLNYPKDEIDVLILPIVELLNKNGFKTFESCQGGEGHCFKEPTVRFLGDEFDLLRAFDLCQFHLFPVYQGRRVFRKEFLYDENSVNPQAIGNIWEKPFNELTFLPIGLLSSSPPNY
jgi:hypothetical protein